MSRNTTIVIIIVIVIIIIAVVSLYINTISAQAKIDAYNANEEAINKAQNEQLSMWDYLQGIPSVTNSPCWKELYVPDNLKSKNCQSKGGFKFNSNSIMGMFG
jgi:uncharacterized membrane protein